MEQWKQITINGEEWNYEVCNLDGKVRNKKTGKLLKPGRCKRGYCIVTLSKNGVQKSFTVHRLVATAFIPNPNNYSDVNHIDENKGNNSASNLEWMPHKKNVQYTQGKKVRCIETGQVFDSIEEAKEWAGVKGGIQRALKTGIKAGGYSWEYVGNN